MATVLGRDEQDNLVRKAGIMGIVLAAGEVRAGDPIRVELPPEQHQRLSTVVTSNLPFDEWTSVFSSERLTGALLDRLTHHVHILEMNGDSYRLNQSKRRSRRASSDSPADNSTQA